MKIVNKDGSLNKNFKKKWVSALRSKKYKQGKEYLYTCNHTDDDEFDEQYCCLGVACKLMDIPSESLEGLAIPSDSFDSNAEIFSDYLKSYDLDKFKVYGHNKHNDDSLDFYLATLNDNGKPFSELADIIEENL